MFTLREKQFSDTGISTPGPINLIYIIHQMHFLQNSTVTVSGNGEHIMVEKMLIREMLVQQTASEMFILQEILHLSQI